MRNRLVPLAVAAREFAKPVFRGSIHWVNGKLLLELFFCIFGASGRPAPRQRRLAKPVMNAPELRLFFQYLFVDYRSLRPVSLRFERLCLEFTRLIGGRKAHCEFLRSAL